MGFWANLFGKEEPVQEQEEKLEVGLTGQPLHVYVGPIGDSPERQARNAARIERLRETIIYAEAHGTMSQEALAPYKEELRQREALNV